MRVGNLSLLTSSGSSEVLGLVFGWGKGCSNCSRNGKALIVEFFAPFSLGKMSSCLSHVLAFGVGGVGGVSGQRGLWIRLGMVLCSVSNVMCSISCAKAEQLESTCAMCGDQSMAKVGAERGERTVPCTAESGKKCSPTSEPSHCV